MKKFSNTDTVKKQRCLHEKSCTSSLVKFPSFRFLLLFFFQDKYISRSFAITFEIISRRKVLFYDSCYAEPQKFWMIFSPKQKKNKKKRKEIALKVFLQHSKISVWSRI